MDEPRAAASRPAGESQGPPPLKVRIGQALRYALKKTVWNSVTLALKRLGRPLQTVQVLVIDPARGQVLCLASAEGDSGYTPVQGLRKAGVDWRRLRLDYPGDPAEDAWRELIEEAVAPDSAGDLAARLTLAGRYWEGPKQSFDCRVFLAEADSRALRLKAEHSEGRPVWLDIEEAGRVFGEPLATVLRGRR